MARDGLPGGLTMAEIDARRPPSRTQVHVRCLRCKADWTKSDSLQMAASVAASGQAGYLYCHFCGATQPNLDWSVAIGEG